MKIKTFIFLSILCCPHVVLANVPSLFGLGSRASGMANSYTAIADDPFGWYYNPAGPASAKEIQLRLGFTSAIDNLQPIQGVILKNDSTVGSVPANYKNTLGTVIGGIIPIWSERVSVGASIFMPLGLVSRVHNQDPYLPSYTFYNDRTHRPNIILGAAWKPLDWFSIGGGVISGTTVGGTIYTDLSGDGGESVIEVKSTQTPTLGMKFYLGNIDVGVSYRGASAGRTKTRIIADSSAMP
ncbi:MAG TPA: hypothetical protein VJL87_05700, partial [Bdellovibrionota bacterium]|nr:hypothetical protein [Bdellovibrionota bacterium]